MSVRFILTVAKIHNLLFTFGIIFWGGNFKWHDGFLFWLGPCFAVALDGFEDYAVADFDKVFFAAVDAFLFMVAANVLFFVVNTTVVWGAEVLPLGNGFCCVFWSFLCRSLGNRFCHPLCWCISPCQRVSLFTSPPLDGWWKIGDYCKDPSRNRTLPAFDTNFYLPISNVFLPWLRVSTSPPCENIFQTQKLHYYLLRNNV